MILDIFGEFPSFGQTQKGDPAGMMGHDSPGAMWTRKNVFGSSAPGIAWQWIGFS